MIGPALIKSLLLHAGLAVVLIASMHFVDVPDMPEPDAPVIQAVMIDSQVIERIEQKKQAAEAEQKRQAEQAAAQAREKERQRKLAIKKREQEKKRKAREQQERLKKQAQEKARKEKEQQEREKARKEAERKRAEAAEKARQEKALQDKLAAEQAARAQKRRQQVLSEVDRHMVSVRNAIAQRWIVDDAMRGKFCRLNIRVATNGLIIQVKILEGDGYLCRSAEAAVYKTESIPVHEDADVFREFRNFNLTMRPDAK